MALVSATCSSGDGAVTSTSVASGSETSTTTSPPTSTITTDVPDDAKPGSLLVLGDWGSGTAPQGAVAGAMARFAEENPIEAILSTGDNLYSDDADFLLQPFDWVEASGIPFWITWGNHDIETSRRVEIVDRTFGNPPRWAKYEWGNVSVLILDSNQITNPDQLQFIEDEMLAITGPTIVVFHHPAFSCSRHGGTDAIQQLWLERFDSDVVLVLSGHDHNYQRIEEDGRVYIVSGGGGRPLYGLRDCSIGLIRGEELHHFVVLIKDEHVIHGTAVDVNGAPFDEFFVDIPSS